MTPGGLTPGSRKRRLFNPNLYKSLDQFKLKNEDCKGCDYNPEEDCSEGCMKLKYYEELDKERGNDETSKM